MNKESQKRAVLKYLRTRGSITTWTAIKELKITRLPARIPELRKQGYLINDAWVQRNGKRYKTWSLVEGKRQAA
jgi:hypothetical protein